MAILQLVACDGEPNQMPPARDAPVHDASSIDAAPPPSSVTGLVAARNLVLPFDIAPPSVGAQSGFAATVTFLAFGTDTIFGADEGNDRVVAFRGGMAVANASSGGSGPAHVAVDADRTHVLVSNYGSGDVIVYTADLATATTPSMHAGANAHQMVVDEANAHVYVPCLGDDRVVVYNYANGVLSPSSAYSTAPGAGPRHLALRGDTAFLINERDSTISKLHVGAGGALAHVKTVSTRAPNASGNNTGAEVAIHPSGKFVYASNRGDNTIAIFSTNDLAQIAQVPTGGATPRSFAIDASGYFAIVGNQGSDTIAGFAIDPATGMMSLIDTANVPGPAFVGFR